MVAVLYPVFQAMLLRWWIGGLRFGELTIRSGLRTGQIYGAYLRFLGYGLLFVIAAVVIGATAAFALTAILVSVGRPEVADVVNAVAGIGFYVFAMLGFSAIYQATVKLGLWRIGVELIDVRRARTCSTGSRPTARQAPRSAKAWPTRSTWAASDDDRDRASISTAPAAHGITSRLKPRPRACALSAPTAR